MQFFWGIILCLIMHTYAFAGDGPSEIARESKAWSILARGPTLTVTENGGGASMFGMEVDYFLDKNLLLTSTFQWGVMGTLGSYTGLGHMSQTMVGIKRFVTNSIYFGANTGIRYAKKGALNQSYYKGDASTDPGYYYDDKYAMLTAYSLGGSGTFGWQWQRQNFTLGFEAGSVFLPFLKLYTHAATVQGYEDRQKQADRSAVRLARVFDITIPRLLIGYSF